MNGCAFVFVTLSGWVEVLRVVVRCCVIIVIHTRTWSAVSDCACHTAKRPYFTAVERANVRAYSSPAWCCYFNLIWEPVGMPADAHARLLIYILKLSADMARERVDPNASRFSSAHTHPTDQSIKLLFNVFCSTTNKITGEARSTTAAHRFSVLVHSEAYAFDIWCHTVSGLTQRYGSGSRACSGGHVRTKTKTRNTRASSDASDGQHYETKRMKRLTVPLLCSPVQRKQFL